MQYTQSVFSQKRTKNERQRVNVQVNNVGRARKWELALPVLRDVGKNKNYFIECDPQKIWELSPSFMVVYVFTIEKYQ